MNDWRDMEDFPNSLSKSWLAMQGNNEKLIEGEDSVKKLLKKWKPIDNILVYIPGHPKFLPPLLLPEVKEYIHKNLIRNYQISFLLMTISLIIFFVASKLDIKNDVGKFCNLLIFMLIFIAIDYKIVILDITMLSERNLFAIQLRKNLTSRLKTWREIAILSGLAQVIIQSNLNNFDILMDRYGAVYSRILSGEWWRIFTGIFIHGNFLHWLSNIIFLLFAGLICSVISKKHAIYVFLLSSYIGLIAGLILAPITNFEAISGFSAGIFGLFGLCGGVATLDKKVFPRAFLLTCITFSMLNAYLSWLMNPLSSLEAHISGFLIGFCYGSIMTKIKLKNNIFTSSEINKIK